MRRPQIIFLIAFLFLVLPSAAQESRLSGVVVNAENGDSLPGAILQYKRFQVADTTDAGGSFDIVKLAEYLTVSADGFQTLRFLIGANTPSMLRITLRPEPQYVADTLLLAEINRINQMSSRQFYFKPDPIRNLVSHNFIDGFHTRLGGQTTGKLSPHWFLKGYVAHGWKSKNNYYGAEVSYSLNAKEKLLADYPRRSFSLSSTYNVMLPSEMSNNRDDENVFNSLRWAEHERMLFQHRHRLSFYYDWLSGITVEAALKLEKFSGFGELQFPEFHTSEVSAGVKYSPTAKQSLALNHYCGIGGFLGADYGYNLTEVSAFQRFDIPSWGALSFTLKCGKQWDEVPFMLLIMPQANSSIFTRNDSFSLMEEMEFLNDRYASIDVSWNLMGRYLSQSPLLKKIGCQEFLGFRCLWGSLSEKNQPLPAAYAMMDGTRPYCEATVGVCNIYHFLNVYYVRRLNYNAYSCSPKGGIRIGVKLPLNLGGF